MMFTALRDLCNGYRVARCTHDKASSRSAPQDIYIYIYMHVVQGKRKTFIINYS